MSSRAVLKSFFNLGDIPTEAQFADLIDSLAHAADDGLASIAYVDSQVATRVPSAGGTLTGPLLAPNGSLTNCAYGFSAAANTGMNRTADGVVLVHLGTAALDVRNSVILFGVNPQPSTDNARTLGAFNFRFARAHATHYRATLGSGASLGYLFDDGAGNVINSGMYAVSTTTLGFNLNGTSQATFTSAGLTLQQGVFTPTAFTAGTLPSAAANARAWTSVSNEPVYSDGTNWRKIGDNTIIV